MTNFLVKSGWRQHEVIRSARTVCSFFAVIVANANTIRFLATRRSRSVVWAQNDLHSSMRAVVLQERVDKLALHFRLNR